jgi:hypothetical protein
MKRFSRRTVRLMAWGAGAVSFGLPWAAFQLIPRPAGSTAAQQVITAPAGSTVTIMKSPTGVVTGVRIVTPKGARTRTVVPGGASVATTRGSVPPP